MRDKVWLVIANTQAYEREAELNAKRVCNPKALILPFLSFFEKMLAAAVTKRSSWLLIPSVRRVRREAIAGLRFSQPIS